MDFSHVLGPETTLKSTKKVQIIREVIFQKKYQHIGAILRDNTMLTSKVKINKYIFLILFFIFRTLYVPSPLNQRDTIC